MCAGDTRLHFLGHTMMAAKTPWKCPQGAALPAGTGIPLGRAYTFEKCLFGSRLSRRKSTILLNAKPVAGAAVLEKQKQSDLDTFSRQVIKRSSGPPVLLFAVAMLTTTSSALCLSPIQPNSCLTTFLEGCLHGHRILITL